MAGALKPRVLVLCLAASCISYSPIAALTIYRVGGESLPAPDAESLGAPASEVRFVQLAWDEVHDDPFGSVHLIDVQGDSIRPDFVSQANLIPETLDRGGLLTARYQGRQAFGWDPLLAAIFDGDSTTVYRGNERPFEAEPSLEGAGSPFCITRPNFCKYIHMDLPGAYPLQRIRIYPAPGNEESRFIPTYTIGVSDGDPLKVGEQDRTFGATTGSRGALFVVGSFDIVSERIENQEPVLEFEFSDEPVKEVIFIAPVGDWEIAEFETIFDGFAINSNFTTEPIDLEIAGTLGPLSWSGGLHHGASVKLRTRAGNTEDPNIYYRNTYRGSERSRFDFEGLPLTRGDYSRLETGEQGGIAPDLDNWSHWIEVLEFAGGEASLAQTTPTRYVQFSTDFNSGGRLDHLQFAVTQPPVLTAAKAEIEPGQVPARQSARFSYLIAPTISAGDLGFDTIEIETPTRIDSVVSVAVDRQPLESSRWQATIGDSSFVIGIPRMDDTNTGELVEIIFHTRVFDFGTTFSGWAFDGERPWEVRQPLQPGNADLAADSNSLTVELVDVAAATLGELSLSTPVLTPNGDDVNDVLAVDFELVNLSVAVPVRIEVFNLSGQLVAEIAPQQLASGPHRMEWDGRDIGESLPSPGIYVLRLSVDTDEETIVANRITSLAY